MMKTNRASKQKPSDMVETTPRLGFIELNVAAEIFASERDLLGATYKGMTLVDVAILQGSAQTATQLARHGGLPQQLSLFDLVTTTLCLCYTGETTKVSRCAQVAHGRTSATSTSQ